MRKFKHLLMVVVLCTSATIFAQTKLTGKVVDETSQPLPGASIVVKGSSTGVSTDFDGNFTLETSISNGTIVVSFVGYETKNLTFNGSKNFSSIALNPSAEALSEIVITQVSFAIDRKTPVAVSTISASLIENKLGTQEFPEILKSTPGIYATKQGGGYGDSRVNLRGFESANIAVMVNGVPVNDMEWGGVYWSNWAGLSDVTRAMQVQRGLGASKIAAPSLGGSINIVTQSTDAVEGGAISQGIGNDGYSKTAFSYSTGLTEKNWAVTVLGSKTSGDGYIQGTEFEGYNYFLNISKKINDNHELSFTAFGAPQWHNQRNNGDRLLISEWQKQPLKYKYNASYGFDMNGQRKVSSLNVYHKPQISLNHLWTIDDKSSLSTALYVSIGDGSGTSGQGNSRSLWYGSSNGVPNTAFRAADGTFDYGAIYDLNLASENGSELAMSKSINQHKWYGALSTYSTKIGEDIDVYGGVDLRYYKGVHTNEITDLYGGNFFIDGSSRPLLSSDAWKTNKLGVGDVVYRDYDGFVFSQGIFMQAEYNKDNLSTFISLSGSNTDYWRYDRFYYDEADAKSETVNFLGFSVKGGANYNIDDNHNVFANVGTISRAPFFSGGAFLQSTTSNETNPNSVNEKAFSYELGYGYRSATFSANVNLYSTQWNDKTLVRRIDSNNQESLVVNMEGVNALHQGIELDFRYNAFENLTITGMASFGDWIWNNDASGYLYNSTGNAVDENGLVVDILGPDHATTSVNIDGIRVGNSAQTTAALGVRYDINNIFNIGIDANYFGRNYANYNISSVGTGLNPTSFSQPWMIPDATTFDLNASTKFKIGSLDARLSANIQNLLNVEYITDATDGDNHDWKTSPVFYGFGRTFSTSLKIKF